ncbi:MAG TPA: MBL fold metallo-hydrolase [Tepidisphaeraceae bacterium]|jgi:glyoxylase-like metal-dependent hydrolase (beta-lactamase superfamily II)
MIAIHHTGGIAATNCYLIGDEATRQAVIFDAPNDTVTPLLDEAEKRGLEVIGLWLTHGHFDHVADHVVVTGRFPLAKVLIHKLDEPKLKEPGSSMFLLPFEIPPRSADEYVEDGQKLRLGEIEFKVIFTPGHSPGHVMYYAAKEKLLIGGDLIIMGAVGRTDLPDSDERELFRSIRRVMKLPDDTVLLPGHGQPSLLSQERQNNPYVQLALEQED